MIANIAMPQRQLVTPNTAEAMSPLTQVFIMNGVAGI